MEPTAQGESKSRTGKTAGIGLLPTVPAFLDHPQSSGNKGRTGHLTMTQLNHDEMQDCLSWCRGSVSSPVWQRSPHCTQRLPVMGLAASTRWISLGIRHGNMTESQKLRGRGTVLEAPNNQL
jgi:hypothetical protein